MNILVSSALEKILDLVTGKTTELLKYIANKSESSFKDKVECFIKNEIEEEKVRNEVEAYFKNHVENADRDQNLILKLLQNFYLKKKNGCFQFFSEIR